MTKIINQDMVKSLTLIKLIVRGRLMTIAGLQQGGCLCGAIRYQLTATPFSADFCHCRQCQKSTGSVLGAWMDFNIDEVS
jgi:hypothetical protein